MGRPEDHALYRFGQASLRAMRRYHHHEVYGFEHVPRDGPALLVFNHSLATYDAFLLEPLIRDELGRQFHGLADRLIFKTPGLGKLFADSGFVVGTRENAVKILKDGGLLGLAPGGMKEALRDSREKYRIDWGHRSGFAWVACATGAPVLLCACPKSDDIYRVYRNPLTPRIYRRFKVPAPVFRGRGISWMPRKVKLWHLISEPQHPPGPPTDDPPEERVATFHARLVERMERLMVEALEIAPSAEPGAGAQTHTQQF